MMTWRARISADQGTVLGYAIAGVLLVVAVALVLADTSSLYMRRTALMMVADDAAIAAANAIDLDAIYTQGVGDAMTLDPFEAHALAQESVDAVQDARLREVRLDAVSVSGSEVEVVVSAAVPSPISGITGDRNMRIRVRAWASTQTRF
jgi:uncharacterized membrane protein